MDLNVLTPALGKPIAIRRVQLYDEETEVNEYVQGILKEVRTRSILIDQCFTDVDYMDGSKHNTIREFHDDEFIII